jgi:hypothetical protein
MSAAPIPRLGPVSLRKRRICAKNTSVPDPTNFTISSNQIRRLGGSEHGDITMTDAEKWKERRAQVARYRVLEQETTDPLAACLLHDIVLELEADVNEPQGDSVETNASHVN